MRIKQSRQIEMLKEELVSSKNLLKEIQKVVRLGNWEVDLKTDIVNWSDETYAILGITEKITKPSLEYFLSFIIPRDFKKVKKKIGQALASSRDYSFCCRIQTKADEIKDIHCVGIFEFDNNNCAKRLYGIIHDISELKQLQSNMLLSKMSGEENERERFSRELHDGLGQMLSGISMQLNTIKFALKKEKNNLQANVARANLSLNAAMHEVRSISHNLSPCILREYGLSYALRNICSSITGLDIYFRDELKQPLDKNVEIVVY